MAISHCGAISARQTTNTGNGSFFLLSAFYPRVKGRKRQLFLNWLHKALIAQDNNYGNNSSLGIVLDLF
jgi:hypothetical protein